VTVHGNDQSDTDFVMDLTTDASVNLTDQLEWIPGTATTTAGNAVAVGSLDNSGDVLAFRVMSASGTTSFLSTSWWGSSDSVANALWAGFASSTAADLKIGDSSVASGGDAINTVQYYLDTPTTQQTGNYTGIITYTATANP